MRTILHSDLNNFYASVEVLRHPEWRDKPLVVCGSKEDRHGIVLAKNMIAKSAGIRTGDVLWEARRKIPDLVEVPVDFTAYLRVSKEVRKIYERYTDRVEAFGIDECWLDVSETAKMFGGGVNIAEEIRRAVKSEIGITASVGVSWNKIFAKLGSDLKKPDAVTEITPNNYKEVVWRLPVEDLLYVGKATKKKLNKYGIFTIGDLAQTDVNLLCGWLGKWGEYLYTFANGRDESPVVKRGEEQNIKSIGNSLTNYRDLCTDDDVKMLILLLSDSIAARLRESTLDKARTVQLIVTDSELNQYVKQGKTEFPTRSGKEIADLAFSLFKQLFPSKYCVRALSVSVRDFTEDKEQLSVFRDMGGERKSDKLDRSLDKIRQKYGNKIIQRATILKDERLRQMDIKGEHVIHPENYFGK